MTKVDVYVVDTGIPVPEQSSRVGVPIATLKVGESVLFPLEKRASVQSAASKLKRGTDRDYTIKKMDDKAARIWRTK